MLLAPIKLMMLFSLSDLVSSLKPTIHHTYTQSINVKIDKENSQLVKTESLQFIMVIISTHLDVFN